MFTSSTYVRFWEACGIVCRGAVLGRRVLGRGVLGSTIALLLATSAQANPLDSTVSPRQQTATKVAIRRFKVLGSRVFRDWELENVTQPYENQTVTLADLQKAADAVTRYYLDHGYMTSRAVLADQTIEGGIAYIQVIEGDLDRIEIAGNKKVDTAYINSRLMRAERAPLNQESLENTLRLLRADPLFTHVEASLQEGDRLGSSILNLRFTEANSRLSSISVDNYNPTSIGSTSITANLGSRNISGYGNTLLLNAARSLTGGANRGNVLYQHPLNPMQGTLAFRVSPNQFRITQKDLKDFDINGRSDLYEVSIRQPIVREPNEEIALGLGVVHRTGVTVVADFLSNSNSSTMLRFSQDWLKRDYGGLWTANSQINLGGSGNQTPDQTTDSQFLTWVGQFQRLQFLGKNNAIVANLNWQLAANELPPAQKFNLGGAQSLRGYPYSFFSADNGISLSLEQQLVLRRNAAGESIWKLSPFVDLGTFWNHSNNVPQTISPSIYTSAGLGLTWQPMKNWSLQLDIALPLRSVEADGRLSPAFYVNSSYEF
jgi:hemolysin activation/secretion protein